MNEESHILFAHKLDGKGGSEIISEDQIEINNKDILWLHLHADKPETTRLLERIGLDSVIVNALTEEGTRPRINEFDDSSLIILRGVNLNENSEAEDMVSVRLFVSKNLIISVRRRKLRAIIELNELTKKGKGPKTSGEFVRSLTLKLCEKMEPTLTELEEMTDNVEEEVMEEPDIKLRKSIIDIRKQAILFRRYLAPQRDVLSKLKILDQKWLHHDDKRYVQESYDRISRYLEDLDAIRERSQIVQDELGNYLSDKLNKNMYVLSVIAAIFLPLGFLTGLLGINVGGIPGADNPTAFWVFIGILSAIVTLQVFLFKKLKWF